MRNPYESAKHFDTAPHVDGSGGYRVFCSQPSPLVAFLLPSGQRDGCAGRLSRPQIQPDYKLRQVMDPLADKLMLITTLICLYLTGRIPMWVPIVIGVKGMHDDHRRGLPLPQGHRPPSISSASWQPCCLRFAVLMSLLLRYGRSLAHGAALYRNRRCTLCHGLLRRHRSALQPQLFKKKINKHSKGCLRKRGQPFFSVKRNKCPPPSFSEGNGALFYLLKFQLTPES